MPTVTWLKAGRMTIHFGGAFLLLMACAGCMRRDGRNSGCKWPGESPVEVASPRHLSADAEFAEDLAIRYADTHWGYDPGRSAALQSCQAKLNQEIAELHHVPVADVEFSLGRNREHIDAATYLPYLSLFCALSFGVARMIWIKYQPAENGWLAGVVMSVFLGILLAIGNTIIGEMWAWLVEGYRVGNEHMSYRAFRLWWALHRGEMLILSILVFAAAATWTGLHAARIQKRVISG